MSSVVAGEKNKLDKECSPQTQTAHAGTVVRLRVEQWAY